MIAVRGAARRTCPPTISTTRPSCRDRRPGRPRLRPGRAPRCPRGRRRRTTCASSSTTCSTTTRSSSCGPRTRRTSSPASAVSAGAPSASSPTSRCTRGHASTSRRRGRRPASCSGATASTCRSSRSSTRPASSPAATSSGAGMIRHGAELVHAYAAATVPAHVRRAAQGVRRRVHRHGLARARQRLVRRVAEAEIAVMGAAGAVQILHRRRLDAIDDPAHAPTRNARSRRSTRSGSRNPYVAAERGYVDEVIAATRHPARARRRARAPVRPSASTNRAAATPTRRC